MTLRQLRDGSSVAQVSIAVAAVAFAGGVRWFSLVAAGLLAIWAFARTRPLEPSLRASRMWTAGIFVALVATLVRAFSQAEFLDAGVDFLLLLIVQRLFVRRRAREHMQLLLLGALMMVVASVISSGLDYPVLFFAYLPTTVFALIMNHLMSEGERLGPRVALEVERHGARAWRTLARAGLAIATLAALGALLTFVAFPRFGTGMFLRGAMARETRSGFAGEVTLGDFGRIKDDASVVMRLQPIDPPQQADRLTWYLRGSSFDLYENGRWRNGKLGEALPLTSIRGWSTFTIDEQSIVATTRTAGAGAATVGLRPASDDLYAHAAETIRVLVTLEDLGVDVLFVASEPLGAKLRPRGSVEKRARIRSGRNRELRLDKLPGPMRYEFISRIGVPTRAELRSVGEPEVDPDLAGFLVPGKGLSPEIAALARSLTAGAPTRHAKVEAILGHLESFEYSLDLRESDRVRAGADPVEGFLFDTRAGHCEYFATAMALLLREVGVPTRIVNGYYGAHRNRLGDFWSVRQADAHSWVEVHFGVLGWVTFDPTPSQGLRAGDDAALWPAATQVLDAIRHAYLEYVIDYDLSKQVALLQSTGWRRDATTQRRTSWRSTLGVLAGVAASLGLGVWLRRRRRGVRSPEVRIYQRLLRRLSRAGHPRRPAESPSAFARRLTEEAVPAGKALQEFAEHYEALRFGPSGPSGPHAIAVLRQAAQRVRRAR
jgi:protein-glutamine gamma-glutamyltransferase